VPFGPALLLESRTMARKGDPFLDLERVWREMDELMGEAFPELGWPRGPGSQSAFAPRVDVYYCDRERPRAVVLVELPGVDPEAVSLEISGRELIVSGERATHERSGRVYQQMEIEAGPFRRAIELGAEVVAEEAQASYADGILRVELPLRSGLTTRVRIASSDE
jgi:HSP20 family protein